MTTHLLRPFWVLLLLVAALRWMQSLVWHTPYEQGHHFFSVVTLALMASIFYGAFTHRCYGYSFLRAVVLGLLIGFSAQVVVFLSTLVSYLLGLETYFNHPRALNVESAIPLSQALGPRAVGLVAGAVTNGIAAAIGWVLGMLLPKPR